jgi:threonine dehydratase
MQDTISLRHILRARMRTGPVIRKTPVVFSPALSKKGDCKVCLKLEHHQVSGSFKLRGALNAMLCLSREERETGVVGVSTGNYGRALAHSAKLNGVRCVICMSSLVPQNKVRGVKQAGAEVRITGKSQDEAQLEVDRLINEERMIMLPPFHHPEVIAGQGTLGVEILEDIPDASTIVVPLSGGGLAAGVAVAARTMAPDIRIIGVSMERGAAMYASLQAGRPVQVEEQPSLADSLGGGIGLDNRYTFPLVRDLVDEVVLLTEDEIAAGIRHAYWQEGQILEGAGAVGIGALLAGKIAMKGTTVLLLSGANIDPALHCRIISTAYEPQEK